MTVTMTDLLICVKRKWSTSPMGQPALSRSRRTRGGHSATFLSPGSFCSSSRPQVPASRDSRVTGLRVPPAYTPT